MANFNDFLQLSFDFFLPKKNSRLKDSEVRKEIAPTILETMNKYKNDENAYHASNVASSAWDSYKKKKNDSNK